jgi:predicted RND superfamily exporter protein
MTRNRRLSSFHRRLILAVLHVVEHPKRSLTIAGLLVIISSCFAWMKLEHSTDQDQLFSSDVPFFRRYIDFTKDFPENQASYILVEPKDSAHPPMVSRWVEIADAIKTRLDKEKDYVKEVDSHIPLEALGTQGMLFEDPQKVQQDLNDTKQMIPLAKLWGEAPTGIMTFLGDSPVERFVSNLGVSIVAVRPLDNDTASFVDLLASGWNKTLDDPTKPVTLGDQVPDLASLGASDPSRLGYYYVQDQQDPTNHLLLVRVYEKPNFSSGGMERTITAIRAAMNEAAANYPEFKVGLTGRPALEADEMATTDRDSERSEIVALIAVFIGLVVLLRSIWLAVAAEISLLVGIAWTFGWATISVGELNLLSMVFLIALIGIGMDYLIQVLTRYRREASRHADPRVIWAGVFKYVAAPINTACLGAAGAFFVSVFTKFRGAAELGIIASGGLLLCLTTGYVILPALLTLFPAKVRHEEEESSAIIYRSNRSHHWWLVPPALWAILLLIGVPFALRAHFDPSLLNMQAQNLESVKLVQKLQTWFAVELSKDVSELRKVREAVQHLPTVTSTESILTAYDNYDWLKQHERELPTIRWTSPEEIKTADLSRLASKARALASRLKTVAKGSTQPAAFSAAAVQLETFAAKLMQNPANAAGRLSAWQNIFVDHLKAVLAPFHPAPLDISKIPSTLKDHLIGKDGRFALYIYPKKDLWIQDSLAEFVHNVEAAVTNIPSAPAVTGIAINVYHSTSSIEKSFYHATGYALALIFILVLFDLRDIRQTILAISVLAMGLPMLIALMGVFDITWNFANFFGLPILIGAGHEYGVFMVHRYNEAITNPRRSWQKWDVSDRALLACGFVTSASFGFFWALGHHEGLKSLGLVMALGTACIYLATLCMLRPLLLWKLAQRNITKQSGATAHQEAQSQH